MNDPLFPPARPSPFRLWCSSRPGAHCPAQPFAGVVELGEALAEVAREFMEEVGVEARSLFLTGASKRLDVR
jgi:hypothetical protein